jgi:hypothetical protein
LEDWIERLNAFLISAKWNSNLALIIQDYMNRKEYTLTTVDGLLMGITKQVETTMREAVNKFTLATVPSESSYGIELLNYAKNKGLIPEPKRGSGALYALIYWFFENPRNISHHIFTDFSLTAHMMFTSTANYIMNEIERLSKEHNFYFARTDLNYNATSRALYISVADIRKNDQLVEPQMLEMNLVNPDKSMKTYPLQGAGNLWSLELKAPLTNGTYSVYLAGRTDKETFRVSGSTFVVV